jgi:hypothetical protein
MRKRREHFDDKSKQDNYADRFEHAQPNFGGYLEINSIP